MIALTAALALWRTRTAQACEGDNCWERCFVADTPSNQPLYDEIYDVVTGLHRARVLSPEEVSSTTFFFDGTFNSPLEGDEDDIYSYQKDLAAIAVMTLPVARECNPLFFLQYTNWGQFFW